MFLKNKFNTKEKTTQSLKNAEKLAGLEPA